MGAMQVLTSLLLLLASHSLRSSAAPPPSGYRSTLTHVDSHGGFTKAELMRRAAHRSRHRASSMVRSGYSTMSKNASNPGPTRIFSGQAGEYLMELAIGTPPVPFLALADTGSFVTWTQCKPCKLCFPQATPIYDAAASSSFSPVPCGSDTCGADSGSGCVLGSTCRYHVDYADGAYSAGVLGTETITFGAGHGTAGVSVDGIAFGCGVDNGGDSLNSTGTVGLGRDNLSLVSQLGVGKFSYCLTDFFNASLGSPVLFGSLAELASPVGGGDATAAAAAVQSTPLVQSLQYPWFYYVSLEGISLGDARLPIPNGTFDLNDDGSGGTIVDSGTTFTILVESAFRAVVDNVADVLGQPAANGSSLDSPCFPAPAGARELPDMPDMVLHFAEGADMRLPRDNYMWFDPESSSFCLNIAGAEQEDGSVLGNFQQQNIHMLYDIAVGRLSFVPTDCSKL